MFQAESIWWPNGSINGSENVVVASTAVSETNLVHRPEATKAAAMTMRKEIQKCGGRLSIGPPEIVYDRRLFPAIATAQMEMPLKQAIIASTSILWTRFIWRPPRLMERAIWKFLHAIRCMSVHLRVRCQYPTSRCLPQLLCAGHT